MKPPNFIKIISFFLLTACYAQHTAQWVWKNGSNTISQPSVYGTQGVPSSLNTPGTRYESMEWTDTAGNFWLYGGWPSGSFAGFMGDLWKYDPTINQWTWVKGPQTPNPLAVHGTKGIPGINNQPYGSCAQHSVADDKGKLWLPMNSSENVWNYNTNTGEWTWTFGNHTNTFRLGTKGVFSATNSPGATSENACSWWHNDLIYLYNYFYKPNNQIVGVMWKYNTLTNQWAWAAGDTANGIVYGAKGISNPQTQPGEYWSWARWKGGDGKLYMMGGTTTTGGVLNSLWRFDPITEQWAWMGGSQTTGTVGNYGTLGVASPTNWPGCRSENRVTWVDKCGNLWMYGGSGYGNSATAAGIGNLNDLWMYSVSSNMWTWKGGSGFANVPSNYGTINNYSITNQPSGRQGANGFVDKAGNFWLFGGSDNTATSGMPFKNDLWMLNTQPTINTTTSVACTHPSGTASVSVFIGESPYAYVWSNGQTTTTAAITGLAAGNYSVNIIDAAGCLQTDTFTILSGPSTLSVAATATISACNAQATALPSGGNAPYQYTWSNLATAATISGIAGGIYSVSVSDSYGCTAISFAAVSPAITPSLTVTKHNPLCYGISSGSIAASATGTTGGYLYSWSNGATSNMVTGLSPSNYTVVVTDLNGCITTETVTINQPLPITTTVINNADTCFSGRGSAKINSVTGGIGAYSYSWSTGATGNSLSYVNPGTYYLTTTDSFGCIKKDTFVIGSINPLLLRDSSLIETCEGKKDGAAFAFVSQEQNPITYLWSNGATTNSISGIQGGVYSVTVADSRGCTKQQTITVSTNLNPTAFAGPTQKIKAGESVALNASGGASYSWHPANGISCDTCKSIIVSPSGNTLYYVIVTDSNGCVDIDSVWIEVEEECSVFIPNTFSPNNDGENDTFQLYGNCINDITLSVYNQWGEKIFFASGATVYWDGFYRGVIMNTDVYTYHAQFTLLSGKLIQKKGNISLLR